MQLSKSEFMMFLKHPAWLWLKKHDPKKLPKPDDNLQALFDAGFEFEQYALKRFPKVTEIGFKDFSEYGTMPERTKKALADGAETLFQARFEARLDSARQAEFGGEELTCICDILDRVDDDTFDLYEVKSSTKVKPEHIPDLAFQTVVLENAGFKVRKISVINVNNQYVRKGEIDPIELSLESDVTGNVREEMEKTKYNISRALEIIKSPEMPDPSPRHAQMGSLNEWLEIYKELQEVRPYSIYNLISPGNNRIGDLEDMNVEFIKDIPDDFKLTIKQQAQVEATKRNERIVVKEKIKEFLDSLTYPLHFLDYETAMGVVPLYDGTKPYQQIPFQYSLYTVETPDAEPKHNEYLHKNADNPIYNLLTKLKDNMAITGNVLVWYKSFEVGRNKEMAEMFPEFAQFLEDINSRTADLMEPFSRAWFVDKDFFGSASIKAVMPVVVPNLSYKNLEIQEGASAQRLWIDTTIREKNGVDKDKIFKDLVEYCKMDTLAMVEIWKFLKNL
ncbi:MAG: hypothetical protein A3F94_00450 [Candidatus Spechtbacteria bacterium RIFCSPLOWO2_12_FULL_38_22]|uniref:DUF2779 domain-containing protein n=1 Tax=Candidatus Spechtbacteria bacterium RIFCSPLOWO2_12_FULL_38_22 TaxID=1802165 RepID=A0A1G2HFZ3_9BACT|nr:MAG: hypothetical protein A2728_00745 [Candidatus Spechtbacteria bacterium RIFCSPHIGHO2_01_FULL_38_11]OGZ59499.1 MAG: hypothetical protein A3E58_02375 [Candidatus Spechtbacteria bacterium RIFCSPHIGHO2_12_FULL_38_30]OGZ59818.1 MAG: hypothetical protein A3A00_00190 [Candidatus Spechtbacteria bacterium RIFCSPLOWO2_01_FULL_38_20]OGZ61412.1 MAG: hypothetical protein A3F94_00450 [Candidatus Spechtbacteria bacterium RIFCSPLOWO2_12_FULL_38_22]